MKEIAVISGKGGTGKTSITASLAWLGGKEVMIADCDVDASNMHLLLQPDLAFSEDFYSGKTASIDQSRCIQCGKCNSICRFDAINRSNGIYAVNKLNCEGCGYCYQICPEEAISMNQNNIGSFFISHTRIQSILVHARLFIGADNSGKLVSKIRNECKNTAQKNKIKFILIDGPPGLGCPVIASITSVDYVVLVTEPTVSGLHDLERVYMLVRQFNIAAGCIINKADLNEKVNQDIKKYLSNKGINLLVEIPYNTVFSKAISQGKTIIEHDHGELNDRLKQCWKHIKEKVGH